MAKTCALAEYQRPDVDMEPSPFPWYAVITNVNSEHQAAANLRELGRVYLPVTAKITATGGGLRVKNNRRVTETALFPRYVFVSNTRPGLFPFGKIRGLRGTAGYVRCAGEPLAIPDSVLAGIRRRESLGEYDLATPIAPKRTLADHGLSRGQEMQIAFGAFEGWRIKVEAMTGGGVEVVGFLNMLGGAIQARVPVEALERVA